MALRSGYCSPALPASAQQNQPANFGANTNAIYVSPNCVGQANCYPVKWDTQIVTDATFAAGSSTVATSASDPPFSCGAQPFPCAGGGDVGKSVVGTVDCLASNDLQCQNVFTAANPTIVSLTDAHHAVVSQNAAASSVAMTGSNFSWGTDDTLSLATVASAVLSAKQPISVVFPCGATTLSGSFIRRNVPTNSGATDFPIGLQGCPAQATVIVMRPDSACSAQTDEPGCFFSDNYIGGSSYTQMGMGDRLTDIRITGLGFDNFVGSSFANNQAIIYIAGYSELDNVWVDGLAWKQSNSPSSVTVGIQTYYYDSTTHYFWGGGVLRNSGAWLGGDWPCLFGPGGYTPTVMYAGYCGGSNFTALTLTGTATYGGSPGVQLNNVVLVNGDYSGGTVYQCAALFAPGSAAWPGMNPNGFTGTFVDEGSLISGSAYLYANHALSTATFRFVGDYVTNNNFGPSCSQPQSMYVQGTSGVTVYLENANLLPISIDPTAVNLVSGTVYVHASNLSAPGGGATAINMSGGTLYNLGGNTFSASTFTGGTTIAQPSETQLGTCSGSTATVTFKGTYVQPPLATVSDTTTGNVANVTSTTTTSATINCQGATDGFVVTITPNPI